MSYKISYHKEVSGDIKKIPKNITKRIRTAIEQRLLIDPLKFGDALRRSLQGYRKMRVGNYRIIYKLEKDVIIILKIGHRKDVYKFKL